LLYPLTFTAIASLIVPTVDLDSRPLNGGKHIGTMFKAMMCILSVYLKQSFLIEVAFLCAVKRFIGFVLARLVIVRRYGKSSARNQHRI
jgi:hypothetical protein